MRFRIGAKRDRAPEDVDASASPPGVKNDTTGPRVSSGWLVEREFVDAPEIVMLNAPRSIAAEKFRRLKTTLVHRSGDPVQVIVVSSGAPGEGKSTVAINLALAFAADGDRTLLLDGDLRRPSVSRFLRPPPGVGLSEVLDGKAEPQHAILSIRKSTLQVLPAGAPSTDPLSLLASNRAREFITAMRERYERIVIDTPPIVPFTDADEAGAMSDGILLVVRAGRTPAWVVRRSIEAVTTTEVLGLVFNDVEKGIGSTERYYDRYYHEYYQREGEEAKREPKPGTARRKGSKKRGRR